MDNLVEYLAVSANGLIDRDNIGIDNSLCVDWSCVRIGGFVMSG